MARSHSFCSKIHDYNWITKAFYPSVKQEAATYSNNLQRKSIKTRIMQRRGSAKQRPTWDSKCKRKICMLEQTAQYMSVLFREIELRKKEKRRKKKRNEASNAAAEYERKVAQPRIHNYQDINLRFITYLIL